MVVSCWVKGCSNRADSKVKRGFYTIPAVRENKGEFMKNLSKEQRRLWLSKINRKDVPLKYLKICSDHFIQGKPAGMYDGSNPDWVPTLKLDDALTPRKSVKKQKVIETDCKRYDRAIKRQKTKETHHVARALLELYENVTPIVEEKKTMSWSFVYKGASEKLESLPPIVNPITKSQVDSDFQRLLTENLKLKSQVNEVKLSQESFEGNDEKVKYYTGLPNYTTLMIVVNIVNQYIPNSRIVDLCGFERVLL